ncbi:ADP-ribose pyrophosphatase, mitochondrial-like [Amphiura filiformis]|uniref:ADP-ribose pyrophosphatase, mitochondrial-like n=1 Tax=Amphiura filiformis TaxID=82378 RepID=UPI003B226DBC
MLRLFRGSLIVTSQLGFISAAQVPCSATVSVKRLLTGVILCSQFLCQNTCVTMATATHSKALTSPYPNSKQERLKLKPEQVSWQTKWEEYNPPDFTADKVLVGPVWADPDDKKNAKEYKKIVWNKLDGKVNRQTYEKCKTYKVPEIDGRPSNPIGRTGLKGRGELGKWGPNHAADPIVTRWKRDAKGTIEQGKSGKKVLQFIAIQRKDNQEWAIPGGMVDAGEKVSVALKREFGEEAMNTLEATPQEKKKIKKAVDALFKVGHEVYRGYVDDPRNTDNSWMETIAVNFHDVEGASVGKFKLNAGDDAAGVKWMDISSEIKLYASHQHFIEEVTKRHEAHW